MPDGRYANREICPYSANGGEIRELFTRTRGEALLDIEEVGTHGRSASTVVGGVVIVVGVRGAFRPGTSR